MDNKYPLIISLFKTLCEVNAQKFMPFSLAWVIEKYMNIYVYYVFLNLPGEAEKWRVSNIKYALVCHT